MAQNEIYPENQTVVLNGVLHEYTVEDGIAAYRPCTEEDYTHQQEEQWSPQPDVIYEDSPSDVKNSDTKERSQFSGKFIKGAAKVALFGAVLGGAHIGASSGVTQFLVHEQTVDMGQKVEQLWSDITIPLRGGK